MLSSTSDLPFNSFSVEIVVSSILDHKKFLKERRKQIFFRVWEQCISDYMLLWEERDGEEKVCPWTGHLYLWSGLKAKYPRNVCVCEHTL